MQLQPTLLTLLILTLTPHTTAKALPYPNPHPLPLPQTLINNAPFSGAIYIVDPSGQPITTTTTPNTNNPLTNPPANTNICPATAPQPCSNLLSWCCPTGYTCVAPASAAGLVGCCPDGATCTGTLDVALVTTVTVQVAVAQAPRTTVAGVYDGVGGVVVQGGYCSTLTVRQREK
ncbi:hypothetical protein EJ05DRAFT_160890 [Pseudovirgaria hyperparasitica]|uniref:Uncharacterized protein n=1 Tax=Pseudovirgaria hyperparasitica TaxID=470096 RepID=A0A6A6VXG7_9PEZI|nr:uncharacterized protein EJ05DRAFT_160890 [Pseudovirgaria hyperparasitica]KAF2753957.1 hypothetical protein EJ05DRAFT_160890 [Pseudovirgaria hyperparasitica]